MLSLIVAVGLLFGTLTPVLAESTVTLKSGEVLKGDILSDTNAVLEIRVYSSNRTISSRRSVPRSEILDIQQESPTQAAERVDYFALSKFQLNPDQEQSTDFYTHWMAAFQKFLTDYPKTDKATLIQQRIETCKAERKHVEDGEAKFADQWMSPEKKAPLATRKAIQLLKAKLANLQTQRQHLNDHLASVQKSLAAAQKSLATAKSQPPRQEPIYVTVPEIGHWRDQPDKNPKRYWAIDTPAHRSISGYKTVPADAGNAQSSVNYCQQQVGKDQAGLASLDANINDIQSQIPRLEQEYQVALSKLNPPK